MELREMSNDRVDPCGMLLIKDLLFPDESGREFLGTIANPSHPLYGIALSR